jgi:hypothetical protein
MGLWWVVDLICVCLKFMMFHGMSRVHCHAGLLWGPVRDSSFKEPWKKPPSFRWTRHYASGPGNQMNIIYIGTSKDILLYLHGLPPEWPSTQSLSTFISDLRSSKSGLLKKNINIYDYNIYVYRQNTIKLLSTHGRHLFWWQTAFSSGRLRTFRSTNLLCRSPGHLVGGNNFLKFDAKWIKVDHEHGYFSLWTWLNIAIWRYKHV